MEDGSHLHELLEVLEAGVLTLDRGGGEDAAASVHRLFQSAHNLKSGLAMAGLSRASKLFHTLEDGLDEVRRGRQSWSSAWADAVLETVDRVKACLDQGHDEGLDLDLDVPDGSPDAGAQLSAPDAEAAQAAAQRGHRLYRIEKLFGPGLSQEDFEGHIILDDIRDQGTLLSVTPAWEVYSAWQSEGVVRFLFSSPSDHATLSQLFFDPLIELSLPPPPLKFRALLVDDDPLSLQVVVRGIETLAEVRVTPNGDEAMKAFREAFAGQKPYDVVVLDLDMPGPGGHEVLQTMRDFEASQGVFGLDRCRVFINTSSQDYSQVSKSFRYQADRYFIKPLSVNAIKKQLQEGLGWLEARRRGVS